MFENSMWAFVVAGGPIILGIVIAYALLTRRRQSAAEREESDRATRRLYKDTK